VVHADVCQPEAVLAAAAIGRLIDWAEPVGLLLVSLLHFIPDDRDPYRAVAVLREAMPTGSMLGIAHGVDVRRDIGERLQRLYAQSNAPGVGRDMAGVLRFFGDWSLLPPGLVPLLRWRPDLAGDPPEADVAGLLDICPLGGVAVKP
jgi:hypothetical protein